MKTMRSVVNTLVLVAGIFLLALLVDQIKPLKQFDAFLRAPPQPYLAFSLAFLIFGGVLMLLAMILALVRQGRPMSEAEAEEFQTQAPQGHPVSIFRGKARGRTVHLEASFSEIKAAFRSGAWLRDPNWWPIIFGGVGLILVCLGGFGCFFIFGPPTVKVIVGAGIIYMVARLSWGFSYA
jgi:hypothetical protein